MTRLGLDLGGTFIKWAAVDGNAVTGSGQLPTHADRGPEAVLEALAEVGRGAVEVVGPVSAVGLGLPGLFDASTETVRFLPNLPGRWGGVQITRALKQHLGAPVRLVNDARAFTLAEWRFGAARGASDAAFLVLGTGVGGGLVIDGGLHVGWDGTAGEIGHQTVDPDGPLCGCGNHGCVEVFASASAITARAGTASVEAAVSKAERGDPQACAALEFAARALGIGIANVVATLAPQVIVIGGGVAQAGEVLFAPIRAELAQRVSFRPSLPRVLRAELGAIAGAVGAALYAGSGQ